MTNSELVNQVSQHTGIDPKTVEQVVNKTLESIVREVAKGEDVFLSDFGCFKLIDRPRRVETHPSSGRQFIVHALRSPQFLAGNEFRKQCQATR